MRRMDRGIRGFWHFGVLVPGTTGLERAEHPMKLLLAVVTDDSTSTSAPLRHFGAWTLLGVWRGRCVHVLGIGGGWGWVASIAGASHRQGRSWPKSPTPWGQTRCSGGTDTLRATRPRALNSQRDTVAVPGACDRSDRPHPRLPPFRRETARQSMAGLWRAVRHGLQADDQCVRDHEALTQGVKCILQV